jgi:hypothetical protein
MNSSSEVVLYGDNSLGETVFEVFLKPKFNIHSLATS